MDPRSCTAGILLLLRRRALASAPPQTRRFSADAAAAAGHRANKTQVHVSRSTDPLLNLSVEHRLLQVTPPDSTVLVLYVNAPCVVLGRNQNPWLEVDLDRLARIAKSPGEIGWTDAPVGLVRRRSGGGTVFHDLGNVNYSVICPPRTFDRDRHAQMVVRALRALGRPGVRVNGRHDIVIHDDLSGGVAEAGAGRATSGGSTFKISGSAYKLTRLRSLHHGTCLLRSPNLASIAGLLRSPAEPFVKARGVGSVPSPVRNVDLPNDVFQDAVVKEFSSMYGPLHLQTEFTDDALMDAQIRSGYQELASRDWTYGQTPRFAFCTHPTEQDPRPRPQLTFDQKLHFEARNGRVDEFQIDGYRDVDVARLGKTPLQDVHDWRLHLARAGLASGDAGQLGIWLNQVLGTEFTQMPFPANH
ncbi:uncharacterized protein UV8b_05578 [Ustilaginoidea virens]|uniref:Putative lipoate-protein ligase A n=1 Tax=Ustilaginoidea virens TaxID=1159556 RepID=A0A063C2Y9_USTVR|nr:uncharacterized protein UV8b_05578 [Ustilaginoidea virens]QUC21335.1 hypothetical protein UV8b_05578 [Ustilaginoidea virens]GAO16206.1 hypothetical protein UVI_02045020 [Ustilaginoidea virens]